MTGPAPQRTGIVAGGGGLPRRLVAACQDHGRPVVVFAFRAITDPETLIDVDHVWSRLGGGRAFKRALSAWHVGDLCFAGRFRRPSLLELAPDPVAAAFLIKVGWRRLGDARLMDAIVAELESLGHRVIAPQAILGDLLSGEGALTKAIPDDTAWDDILRGQGVARRLGLADAGQGVVVQQGVVLAIEAAEGTDSMLARCTALRREGPGGVLVKACKPQQDSRMDLPTIGTDTVRAAHAAGLRGIAVEAGAALIVGSGEVAALADALGLFVIGLPQPPQVQVEPDAP